MKFSTVFAGIAIIVAFAACGGGGGSGGGGSIVPVTTPSPGSGTQSATISGNVVQMTGPLSSSTWNLAAPTGCPNSSTNGCASYSTSPPTLPSANATPGAGSGIAGATVYAVATSANLSGTPSAPLAQATTGPTGSFSLTVSGATQVALVAVNGTPSPTTGSANGYTIAHAIATAGTPVTLYLDRLSGDEQSAFSALNEYRSQAGQTAIYADTILQADARLLVSQMVNAASCSPPATGAFFQTYTGLSSSLTSGTDVAGPQWYYVLGYGANYFSSASIGVGGLAALYQSDGCGGDAGLPTPMYETIYGSV